MPAGPADALAPGGANGQGESAGQSIFVQQMFARVEIAAVNGPSATVSVAEVMLTEIAATGPDRIDPATAKAAPAPAHGFALGAYAATQPQPAGTAGAANEAPPVAEQIGHAILARIEVATAEGRIDFHLRLDPPELGQVRVQLTLTEQTLTARLVVRDDAARQLVQSQMETLRQRLQETGLSLGQLDVSGDGGGGGRGQRQQPLLPFPDPDGGGTARRPTPERRAPAGAPAGRIDVVA